MNQHYSLTYELSLPAHIRVHNVFHSSLLKKYVYDTKHVIDWSLLQVKPEGEFSPELLHILDKREVQIMNHTIVQLKVQWKNFEADQATRDNEATMRKAYSTLFHDFIMSPYNTRDAVVPSGEGCNILNVDLTLIDIRPIYYDVTLRFYLIYWV